MAGKAHPSDWRNASPSTQRLALLAMLGVIGGVLLAERFSATAAGTVVPTLIARNSAGETLLANGSTLFLVDAGEARIVLMAITDLGLRPGSGEHHELALAGRAREFARAAGRQDPVADHRQTEPLCVSAGRDRI